MINKSSIKYISSIIVITFILLGTWSYYRWMYGYQMIVSIYKSQGIVPPKFLEYHRAKQHHWSPAGRSFGLRIYNNSIMFIRQLPKEEQNNASVVMNQFVEKCKWLNESDLGLVASLSDDLDGMIARGQTRDVVSIESWFKKVESASQSIIPVEH